MRVYRSRTMDSCPNRQGHQVQQMNSTICKYPSPLTLRFCLWLNLQDHVRDRDELFLPQVTLTICSDLPVSYSKTARTTQSPEGRPQWTQDQCSGGSAGSRVPEQGLAVAPQQTEGGKSEVWPIPRLAGVNDARLGCYPSPTNTLSF